MADITHGGDPITGDTAHDAADSGRPLKIGGKAITAVPTAVAASDRTDAIFDVYGQQFVRPDPINLWSYHENSSSALTDTEVKAAPGAGLSIYITDLVISLGAATAFNAFFEEGTTTTVLGPYYLEAVNGRGVVLRWKSPKKLTANVSLTVTTSGAVLHSIDVSGFVAP